MKRLRHIQQSGRGIWAGIATGGMVKVTAMVTNLVAMPLAVHALGEERFGVFMMLMGISQWVTLGNFGMQTTIAKFLAEKGATVVRVRMLAGAGIRLAAVTAVFMAAACGALILEWFREKGAGLAISEGEVLSASALLLVLMFAKTVLQTFSGVLIGTLKIYLANIFQMVGQVSSILLLGIVSLFWHHLAGFVLALVGGLLAGDVSNAGHVLRTFGWASIPTRRLWPWMWRLVSTGLSFVLINLVSFGSSGLLIFWVGAASRPEEAASFGLMMRMYSILIGLLAIANAPLWPAILDALKRGDEGWLRRTLARYFLLELSIGLAAGALVMFFGSQILYLWVRRDFSLDSTYTALWGAVLLQATLAYFWGIVLIGMKREGLVAVTHLLRFATILVIGSILVPENGGRGAMMALAIAYLLAETFVLPIISWRIFRRHVGERIIATSLTARSKG